MKNTLTFLLLISLSAWSLQAYTLDNLNSANFIAAKWVINDKAENPFEYNLDFNITRREMLKVVMNLSGRDVSETCEWTFSDVVEGDWWCKYVEAALREWYIAANETFRPDDNITQIEALKTIMQSKGIERDLNDDWRAWYVSKAKREKLINDEYLEYNDSAVRGWIFSASARSFSDFEFSNTQSEIPLTKEEEDLFDTLFDL